MDMPLCCIYWTQHGLLTFPQLEVPLFQQDVFTKPPGNIKGMECPVPYKGDMPFRRKIASTYAFYLKGTAWGKVHVEYINRKMNQDIVSKV